MRGGEGEKGGEGLEVDISAELTACDRVFLWGGVGFLAVPMTRRLSSERGQCGQL